ncbi:hypothetical protein Fbal_2685 [Ferrimonas balearica DSM 9799]|uniref:SHOCT domain-containing protein n=1 Tax=Ferrimonas balearica (strain DSM 9799 / CCM 4581 / KCTC 23876 / PAT) TaxID=550540 RepID=E1SQW2_FERBD|nr:hypothetical protein [Ferrimonas balearica]ADN76887.1 hypothetical protein Fbal_2685 [Ferrimonas balearica DSM 9799]MBY5979989.1 hypothetical protein [Ferrimonas balearica]
MKRLTRWMVVALLGLVSTGVLANSIRIERAAEGPVSVEVERDEERVTLELDPANPDWDALDAALGDDPNAERWRSMIESVLNGEGPLTLALHNEAGVKVIRVPNIELILEDGEMELEIAEMHQRLAEQGVRLQEEAARMEKHMAEVVLPKIFIEQRAATAKAITSMIEHGEFSADELAAIEAALAAKSPVK